MSEKPRVLLTPEFRLSFCSLFEPKPDMNKVVRYSMEMLFPKERGSAQFLEMMKLYNETLAAAKFGEKGATPRTFKEAIIDGNSKKQEGRQGMYMIKANASAEINGKPNKPRLLLPNRMPAERKDIYEGCWCRAIVNCYPYEAHQDGDPKKPVISRGAAFGILTVQKTRDDKPFASYVTDEEQDELLKAAPLEGVEDADGLDLLS